VTCWGAPGSGKSAPRATWLRLTRRRLEHRRDQSRPPPELDQLDALADLVDAKTERLAVLPSLISSVRASGIPVVCWIREFDFKHDTRFTGLDAEEVRLAPLAASDVEAVLKSRGIGTAQVGQRLQSLPAIPHWLRRFVQLPVVRRLTRTGSIASRLVALHARAS
jgi:hypothetical protein